MALWNIDLNVKQSLVLNIVKTKTKQNKYYVNLYGWDNVYIELLQICVYMVYVSGHPLNYCRSVCIWFTCQAIYWTTADLCVYGLRVRPSIELLQICVYMVYVSGHPLLRWSEEQVCFCIYPLKVLYCRTNGSVSLFILP